MNTARVCRRYSRWCSGPQVSDIAYTSESIISATPSPSLSSTAKATHDDDISRQAVLSR
jgi:hypothetical protein